MQSGRGSVQVGLWLFTGAANELRLCGLAHRAGDGSGLFLSATRGRQVGLRRLFNERRHAAVKLIHHRLKIRGVNVNDRTLSFCVQATGIIGVSLDIENYCTLR